MQFLKATGHVRLQWNRSSVGDRRNITSGMTCRRQNPKKENSNNTNHLFSAKASLNSGKRKINCTPRWLCKRMTCASCVRSRRAYFMANGSAYLRIHGLDTHVGISWPLQEGEYLWPKMLSQMSRIARRLSSKKLRFKYIRTLGNGDTRWRIDDRTTDKFLEGKMPSVLVIERQGTPHCHFLVSHDIAAIIVEIAKKIGPPGTRTWLDGAYDPERLLGYFFDQNFLLSYLDDRRPSRVRILSASKGMRCGFPPIGRIK